MTAANQAERLADALQAVRVALYDNDVPAALEWITSALADYHAWLMDGTE